MPKVTSVKEAIINLNGKTNIFECTSGQKIIIIKYAIKKTFTKSLKKLKNEIFLMFITLKKKKSKKNKIKIGKSVAKKITRIPRPKPIVKPIRVEKYLLFDQQDK